MAAVWNITKKWGPAFVLMGIIFWISSWPGETVRGAGLDSEGLHVNGHFVLYFLLTWAFYKATKNILLSIVLAFIYGLTDEFHQRFVPERSASLKDIIVNSLGILSSVFVLWKLDRYLPQKLRNWLNN